MTPSQAAEVLYRAAAYIRRDDHRGVLNAIKPTVLEQLEQRWVTRTDPEGQRWKPRKRKYSHPPLDKTGALKASMTQEGADNTIATEFDHLQITSHVPYAGFHEHGTSKMPARSFAGLTDPQMDRLAEEVADELLEAMFPVEVLV